MNEQEKLEQSREIGRVAARAYCVTAKRSEAIKEMRKSFPCLSFGDCELLWMAIDEYEDFPK